MSDVQLQRHELHSFECGLPEPSTTPHELEFSIESLGNLRRFVSRSAAAASLDSNRAEDLVLAVNELATNSVCHGGGAGILRMWTEAGMLLCEVHDHGYITEPLLGRSRPTATQTGGRGLWIVNNLCDLVQIRSTPAGSVVRVHMSLS